jgi:hypothetical protein
MATITITKQQESQLQQRLPVSLVSRERIQIIHAKADELGNGDPIVQDETMIQKMAATIKSWQFTLTDPLIPTALFLLAFEPQSFGSLLKWHLAWIVSGALSSHPNKLVKAISLGIAITNVTRYPFQHPYINGIYQMRSITILMRILEIVQQGPTYFERMGMGFSARYCFAFHDPRRAVPFPNAKEWDVKFRSSMQRSILGIVSLIGAVIAFHSMKPWLEITGSNGIFTKSMKIAARSYMGAGRLWALLIMSESIYSAHLAWFGLQAPKCFNEPFMSMSVTEFYGKRWNQANGRELRDVFYKPLAKRGYRVLAELSVFVASALLHVYLINVLQGSWRDHLLTFAFFLNELCLTRVEKTFNLKGHRYFHLTRFVFGPLFFEPLFATLPPF